LCQIYILEEYEEGMSKAAKGVEIPISFVQEGVKLNYLV